MKILTWIISRLAAALGLGVALALLAYYVLVPSFVVFRSRQELPLDHFELQSGSGSAGSEDAVYYAARFDCRDAITEISGPAPDAVYWMIGIYDNRFERIPGGHLNDTTVEVDDDGQFHLTIQRRPGNAQSTLECGNTHQGLMIYRVFLPDDSEAVPAPTIERKPLPQVASG